MGKLVHAPRLSAKLDDLSASARREISQSVLEGAHLIAKQAKASMRDGAILGKGHIPSRPGEPPKADTLFLERSFQVEQVGELVAQVGVNASYALPLEVGTSKMAARPFMQPAVNKTRAEVITLFFSAIKRARGL